MSKIRYRPIPEFPGYRAGSDGSIWTNLVPRRKLDEPLRFGEWRKLKGSPECRGYLIVSLCREFKKGISVSVHKLILTSFVGPAPDGMECRHLNGDHSDCRLENLVWGTHQENINDRARHGTTAKGSRNGGAKLTEGQVEEILQLVKDGMPRSEILSRFGIGQTSYYRIIHGTHWKNVKEKRPERIRCDRSFEQKREDAIAKGLHTLPVPDFPGYFASSDGTIWTSKTRVEVKGVGTGKGAAYYDHPTKRHKLKQGQGVRYPHVILRSKEGKVTRTVHTLILITFVCPRPKGCFGRHLNDNPNDNRLENLTWGTPTDNQDDWRKRDK